MDTTIAQPAGALRQFDTGKEAVGLMRAVKQALDPLGILSPGKISAG